MDADTHVYCTKCKHLEIPDDDYDEMNVGCKHEHECNLWDFEDSMPFSNRPYYEEKFTAQERAILAQTFIDKFDELKKEAGDAGFAVVFSPLGEELFLYYHEDYPEMILTDKEDINVRRD
jgi:hypothetical protein